MQYILMPAILFFLIFTIPVLKIDSFEPTGKLLTRLELIVLVLFFFIFKKGAKITIFLTIIVYIPLMLLMAMVFSLLFDKKETAIGVLTSLFMAVFTFFWIFLQLLF